MNVYRLRRAIDNLLDDYAQLDLLKRLQRVANALQQSMAVGNAQQAQAFQDELAGFYDALESSASWAFPPSATAILRAIQVDELLAANLSGQIEEIVAANNIVPAAALKQLQDVFKNIREAHTTLSRMREDFDTVGITPLQLDPGEYEIGILIPATVTENNLKVIDAQVHKWWNVARALDEALTGEVDAVRVRTIESGSVDLYICAAPAVAWSVLKTVEKILDVYKKVLEIRKLKRELQVHEALSKKEEAEVIEAETKLVQKALIQLRGQIMKRYRGSKADREEVANNVLASLKTIAAAIELGVQIEVNGTPEEEPDSGDGGGKKKQAGATMRSEIRELLANVPLQTAEFELVKDDVLHLPEEVSKPIPDSAV